jgi:cephalosporin hydroxylase
MRTRDKLRWTIAHPGRAFRVAVAKGYSVLNRGRRRAPGPHPLPEMDRVLQLSRANRAAIGEHLPALFAETNVVKPRLIVELGVRGGDSTEVLAMAARRSEATLVSVDIDPCTRKIDYDRWHFIQEDDVAFAGRFGAWCREAGIEPAIDVLFIDTSHLYEHTVQEIERWFPLLSDRCKVYFHDTNISGLYPRTDGSLVISWDNDRGVIRALEEYLGAEYDETRPFVDLREPWLIRHAPYGGGLTILERGFR